MAEKPTTLEVWRLTWLPEEIEWRTGWFVERDERRLQRDREKLERRKRDRQTVGAALWGTPAEKRHTATRVDQLEQYELPVIESEAELAEWLNIRLSRLRWYTHDKAVDHTWHYIRYEVPKRRGGKRVILAPKAELKAIQRRVYHDLLSKLPIHDAAHGFVPHRSIVSNASPHVGKAVVLNLDLKDFFPSIRYRQIRGLFLSLGYALPVASALSLLCTEYDRKPINRGGKTVYVTLNERSLVQGAPTSPTLANLVARRLDKRLTGMAQKLGLTYTRYADDLTFSGNDDGKIFPAQELAQAIIADEGFTVHKEKTRIYRQSNRQIVTGIVVNQQTNVPRDVRRMVRAILNNATKTGLEAQNRNGYQDFRAYLLGLIGYIHEANPEHARPLLEQLKSLPD
jgi:RNA-directed DNA polymerase